MLFLLKLYSVSYFPCFPVIFKCYVNFSEILRAAALNPFQDDHLTTSTKSLLIYNII